MQGLFQIEQSLFLSAISLIFQLVFILLNFISWQSISES